MAGKLSALRTCSPAHWLICLPFYNFQFRFPQVGSKATFIKFHDHRKIGADWFTMPLLDNVHNFARHALEVKRLIAMIGIVVNHNGFLNTNAITNFHINK